MGIYVSGLTSEFTFCILFCLFPWHFPIFLKLLSRLPAALKITCLNFESAWPYRIFKGWITSYTLDYTLFITWKLRFIGVLLHLLIYKAVKKLKMWCVFANYIQTLHIILSFAYHNFKTNNTSKVRTKDIPGWSVRQPKSHKIQNYLVFFRKTFI